MNDDINLMKLNKFLSPLYVDTIFYFRGSSVGTFIRQQPLTSSGSSSVDSSRGSKTSTAPPRLDYRSMVSVDDMPELFASFDSEYYLSFIN